MLLLLVLVTADVGLTQQTEQPTNESSGSSQFAIFKTRFAKSYSGEEEEMRAHGCLQEQILFIEEYNKRPNMTYQLKINEHSDLCWNDFKADRLGCFLGGLQTNETAESDDVGLNGIDLPPEIDWEAKNVLTAVKNQRQCGSCWAFAAVGQIEALRAINGYGRRSLSEQQLIECSKVNHGCDGGWPDEALKYVKEKGLSSSSSQPYRAKKIHQCMEDSSVVPPGWVTTVKISSIFWSSSWRTSYLKEMLLEHPVAVALKVDKVFQSYGSGVFTHDLDCTGNQNHAVLLVGYGSTKGLPYWKIRNSWGTSWGMSGYMLAERKCGFPYYAFAQHLREDVTFTV